MKSRRKKVWIMNMGIMLISFVLIVLSAEFFVRLYLGKEPQNEGRLLKTPRIPIGFQGNEGYNSVFIKNNDVITRGGKAHINNVGLRDEKNRQIAKPENIVRIAFFGDSHTFGHGNDNADTYPAQLEKILNSKNRAAKKIEILNFGVSGFNTIQEYIYLRRFGIKFHPDIVLFQWLYDDYMSKGYQLGDLDKIARGQTLVRETNDGRKYETTTADNFFATIKLWIRTHSDLYSYIIGPRLIELYGRHFDLNKVSGESFFSNISSPGAKICFQSTLSSADFCKANGIEFGVFIMPALKSLNLNFHEDHIYLKYENFCKKNHIPILNLFKTEFMGRDASKLIVSKRDIHPNALGQHLVATGLSNWIQDYWMRQNEF